MMTAEGLQVDDVPVMLGGDWNSLWRKYKPDVYDAQVSPTCCSGMCHAFSFCLHIPVGLCTAPYAAIHLGHIIL